jgi:hypothetical protein
MLGGEYYTMFHKFCSNWIQKTSIKYCRTIPYWFIVRPTSHEVINGILLTSTNDFTDFVEIRYERPLLICTSSLLFLSRLNIPQRKWLVTSCTKLWNKYLFVLLRRITYDANAWDKWEICRNVSSKASVQIGLLVVCFYDRGGEPAWNLLTIWGNIHCRGIIVFNRIK